MRRKVISRKVAYHGTTMGALSITGITAIRTPFEPLIDGVRHVANTNRYRCKYCSDAQECTLACADEVAETIEQEGPDTVAMVIMEPVQNSGGTFTPHPEYHRRVREICDHYGVLQVADEVICGFGRLGEWFGCERYGYEPDLITCAKGLTSGYASLGAVLISDRVAEPFVERGEYYLHGITFGGHPMATAIGLANLDVMERLDVLGNVRANEAYFAEQLHGLAGDHDIVGDVRGAGYFMSLELVKDRATRQTFTPEECQVLLREFLSPQLQEAGRDLPRRRPRRSRDPALPAADLHARAHRRGRARARLGAAARPEAHARGALTEARTTAPADVGPSGWTFPDPAPGDEHGLVGVGADLAPATLVGAYRAGVFPWPHDSIDAVPWFSPPQRGVLPLDRLHVSRSLARRLRRSGYETTVDEAFAAVVEGCREPRADEPGTWISDDLAAAYTRLHRLGHAHSLEVWDGERLVGGIYGVLVGGMFCGESMFHRETDASKIALADLVARLVEAGAGLLEVQHQTPHLQSLGAIEIERASTSACSQSCATTTSGSSATACPSAV